VPSLRDLCIAYVSSAVVVNLENSLGVLQLGDTHNIPHLEERALFFIRKSFSGLRKVHPARDLEAALGKDKYQALERVHSEIDAAKARMRQGTVLESHPPEHDPRVAASLHSAAAAATVAAAATRLKDGDANREPVISTAKSAAAAPPRHRFSFGGGGEKCHKCAKTVYAAERIATHGKAWHSACFRCMVCEQKLAMHSVELDGEHNLYCKVHFHQAWKQRGEGGARHQGEYRGRTEASSASSSSSAAAAAVAAGTPASLGSDVGTRTSSLPASTSAFCVGHHASKEASRVSAGAASWPAPSEAAAAGAASAGAAAAGAAAAGAAAAGAAAAGAAPPALDRRLGVSPYAPQAPSVSAWVASRAEICVRCSRTVYALERRAARTCFGDLQVFHDSCFRCAEW
jgi:hypothetical protein